MSIRLAAVLVVLCMLAAPAGARQDIWSHPDETGSWLPWWHSCKLVEGPLRAEWDKQLMGIAALVRACPVFRDIRGYYPELVGCARSPGGGNGPYTGSVALLVWPPETIERTAKGEPKVMDQWRLNHPGGQEGGTLYIYVNAIGDLRDLYVGKDGEGELFELPEPSREVAGFPVVGGFLLVTPPGKPLLFSPITQGRAQSWIVDNLRRQAKADDDILDSARKQYEEFVSPTGLARRAKEIEAAAASQQKPENQELKRRQAQAMDRRREQDLRAASVPTPGRPAARTKERLAHLEVRLASLTPEQRRQPAWYRRHPEGVRRLDYGDIVEAGSPGARPLVVPNSGYFDLSLPKTTMQLISVPFAGHYDAQVRKGAKHVRTLVPATVIEQMDWRALAARLK